MEDPGFDEAQRMLAEYKSNLRTIEIRLAEEKASTEAWQAAQASLHLICGEVLNRYTLQQYAELSCNSIVNDPTTGQKKEPPTLKRLRTC
jgi:hypothetical protein